MAGAGKQHVAQAIAAGGHDFVAPGEAWQAGSTWASQHPGVGGEGHRPSGCDSSRLGSYGSTDWLQAEVRKEAVGMAVGTLLCLWCRHLVSSGKCEWGLGAGESQSFFPPCFSAP